MAKKSYHRGAAPKRDRRGRMREVKVSICKKPNGLSSMLGDLIRSNLEKNPSLREDTRGWNFAASISETSSGVSSTLSFRKGEVRVENGTKPRVSVKISADFETLSRVSTGGMLAGLKAILTRRLKRKGSFSAVLGLQKVLASKR